jgi:hypothetical protein
VLADIKNQPLRCGEAGGQGSPGAAIEPASVSILVVKQVQQRHGDNLQVEGEAPVA